MSLSIAHTVSSACPEIPSGYSGKVPYDNNLSHIIFLHSGLSSTLPGSGTVAGYSSSFDWLTPGVMTRSGDCPPIWNFANLDPLDPSGLLPFLYVWAVSFPTYALFSILFILKDIPQKHCNV